MNERTETMQNPAAATYKKNEVLPSMSTIGRSSWGAIFSGTVMAIISHITLGLLGIALGLTVIGASPTAGALQGVGIGAVVWSAIIAIVAMFFGGWVTARLAGMQRAFDGVLHGLITWGLTSILMVSLLAGIAGAAIGGVMNAYSSLPPGQQEQLQGQMQQQQQEGGGAGGGQQGGVGAQAAQISSGAAWGGFIVLLLGGVAAAIGGARGRIRGPVRV